MDEKGGEGRFFKRNGRTLVVERLRRACVPVIDDSHQSGGHQQRGPAYGSRGTVVGQAAPGILQAERRREAGRTAGHAVHGPRQSDQTLVPSQLHRPRLAPSFRGPGGTVPGTAGISTLCSKEKRG